MLTSVLNVSQPPKIVKLILDVAALSNSEDDFENDKKDDNDDGNDKPDWANYDSAFGDRGFAGIFDDLLDAENS